MNLTSDHTSLRWWIINGLGMPGLLMALLSAAGLWFLIYQAVRAGLQALGLIG